jgi:hypothetical protein
MSLDAPIAVSFEKFLDSVRSGNIAIVRTAIEAERAFVTQRERTEEGWAAIESNQKRTARQLAHSEHPAVVTVLDAPS